MSKRSRTTAFKQAPPKQHHFEKEEEEEDDADLHMNSDSESENEIEAQMAEIEEEKVTKPSAKRKKFTKASSSTTK